jgi:hypothetical protein
MGATGERAVLGGWRARFSVRAGFHQRYGSDKSALESKGKPARDTREADPPDVDPGSARLNRKLPIVTAMR